MAKHSSTAKQTATPRARNLPNPSSLAQAALLGRHPLVEVVLSIRFWRHLKTNGHKIQFSDLLSAYSLVAPHITPPYTGVAVLGYI